LFSPLGSGCKDSSRSVNVGRVLPKRQLLGACRSLGLLDLLVDISECVVFFNPPRSVIFDVGLNASNELSVEPRVLFNGLLVMRLNSFGVGWWLNVSVGETGGLKRWIGTEARSAG
jgi:hypothetical protein